MRKIYYISMLLIFIDCFAGLVENSHQSHKYSNHCTSCALQAGETDKIRDIVFSAQYFEDMVGGVISATQHFEARQDCSVPIPGFIIIASKRHVQSIDELSNEERTDFIEFLYKIRKGMREKLNITTVYIIQEEDAAHFHAWLFPRYDWMEKFGKKIKSVKQIMNWSQHHLNTQENIEKIKEAVKKLQEIK